MMLEINSTTLICIIVVVIVLLFVGWTFFAYIIFGREEQRQHNDQVQKLKKDLEKKSQYIDYLEKELQKTKDYNRG